MTDCLFCKIVSGDIPAKVVHQDKLVTAFRDINPQAPSHILIAPNAHLGGAADLTMEHGGLLAAMFHTANQLAVAEGLMPSGYRLVINQGSHGGQTVFHLHMHLLGGRPLTWPPG